MAKSKHIQRRMSQRGITNRMLEIVQDFGVIEGDKYILSCKNIDALLKKMNTLKKDFLKIRDKGGVVIVESNNTQITTYNLNSYNPKLKRNH